MDAKSARERLAPLLEQAYFTSREAARVGVSSPLLAYYVKIGVLERLARGVYRGVNAPGVADFRWEDLVLAMARVKQGVVCLVTALALYELTEELPRQHWIAIPHGTRHRAGATVKVVRMRNITLGQTTLDIDGIALPIFDRERTLVDAFKYLSKETAIKALKAAVLKQGDEKIDLEKVRKYAKVLRVKMQPYLLMVST